MTLMSDEELKRKQTASSASNSSAHPKVKLESDSNPQSSLLVNLLQNKDEQQSSEQSTSNTTKSRAESTAQLGSGSSSHHANKSRRKTPSGSGAILNSNLERNSDILN